MRIALAIFSYNRRDLFAKMYSSLKNCRGVEHYDAFIFSDAGTDSDDRIKVEKVRKYILKIENDNCFKKVAVKYNKEHTGLSRSIINGVTEILEIYDAVITLEDDLSFSKDFLEFMNSGLNAYRDDKSIWSISGYCPYLAYLHDYKEDTFLGYRASSWGWGTWNDRWMSIDWEVKDYKDFENAKELRKQFERGGHDMSCLLDKQMRGLVDSWAIRWCFAQWKQDKYTVFPRETRVQNNGFGKEATHTSRPIGKIQNMSDDHNKARIGCAELDEQLAKEFQNYYKANKLKSFIRIRVMWDWFHI